LGVQAANSTVTAVVTLVATLEDTGGKKHTATYLLDRRKFDAGRPVEEFLKPASQNEVNDDGDPVNLAAILRGLPESRYFNAAGPAYVPAKSGATKAWKVERGAARVFVEDPILGPCWHRCDIQYCDQLPFGVLQWKTAINSDITGEVLDTQTWVADEGSAERTEQP
jgi:hypothetical protein